MPAAYANKILLVDDSPTVRTTIKSIIFGFSPDTEVIEAQDGKVALSVIARNNDIDLIFMDYHMPLMNGAELMAFLKVRADAGERMPPVIMLTSESTTDAMSKVRVLGIKGWIIKPAKPEQIEAVVKKFVATKPAA